jgi:hypothetical protein
MHRNPIALGLLVALATATGGADAAVFCVGTATSLQNALATAATNTQNNTIKVRAGTYRAPDAGFMYWRQSGSFNLDLEGGWNAGCTEQTEDASLTVLDGRSQHAIINFAVFGSHSTARMTLRYFDMYHGVDQRGFSPIEIDTEAGSTRVENSRIRDNTSTDQYAPVASIDNYGGSNVYFLDNVVADNEGRRQAYLMQFAVQGGGKVYFNNNTVTANLFATLVPAEGTIGFTHASLANNILWANAGHPEIATQFAPLLIDNDIDLFEVTPAAGSIGNIDADPRFLGPSNRRLHANSPACDAGDNTPPGTTRSIDLDGNPRRVRTVDMGAYELQGDCS